jgi:UDP-glucose 4-epimerase
MMTHEKVRCTVLGANSYIGRHLCYYLDKIGWDVKLYGKNPIKHPSLPKHLGYHSFDITDAKSVEEIDLEVDLLFVFSGLTGTKNSFDQFRSFTEVNEIGLLNVLNRVALLTKKPRIVFPSSRLVYKGNTYPLIEEDLKESKTIYAANKLNCEQFLKTYRSQFNIHFTIFRICVPYGNLLDSNFSFGTIGFFLKEAKAGRVINLFGDGQLRRTFTPIELLCEQIIEACKSDDSIDEVYNIGGEPMTLLQAVTPIAEKYNVEIKLVPWPEVDLKLESGDTVFDSSKIDNLINLKNDYSYNKWIESL